MNMRKNCRNKRKNTRERKRKQKTQILELKAKLGLYEKVTKSDKGDSFDENKRDDFLM